MTHANYATNNIPSPAAHKMSTLSAVQTPGHHVKIGQKGSGGCPDQGATKERMCVCCRQYRLFLPFTGTVCRVQTDDLSRVILTDGQSVMCVSSHPDSRIGLPR